MSDIGDLSERSDLSDPSDDDDDWADIELSAPQSQGTPAIDSAATGKTKQQYEEDDELEKLLREKMAQKSEQARTQRSVTPTGVVPVREDEGDEELSGDGGGEKTTANDEDKKSHRLKGERKKRRRKTREPVTEDTEANWVFSQERGYEVEGRDIVWVNAKGTLVSSTQQISTT